MSRVLASARLGRSRLFRRLRLLGLCLFRLCLSSRHYSTRRGTASRTYHHCETKLAGLEESAWIHSFSLSLSMEKD
ncbi:hypothetical protein C7974DRAFT_403012 [Boeremia exigua]|uniref:uncharacterized protein n=1 Tax=Boeremia exigua TaxID=749465 RepID=UPI001E8EE177|nr:uncharacterized protein C7974DRAFT_403012 [Boeremia exigua]KAH6614972.1 hypothetical protein C7974DRAFT_403012 [Boeremia exigua]